MDVVRKMTAICKAAAAEEAKDPRQQQIAKKKAELAALEALRTAWGRDPAER